jgi:hypothetical protein
MIREIQTMSLSTLLNYHFSFCTCPLDTSPAAGLSDHRHTYVAYNEARARARAHTHTHTHTHTPASVSLFPSLSPSGLSSRVSWDYCYMLLITPSLQMAPLCWVSHDQKFCQSWIIIIIIQPQRVAGVYQYPYFICVQWLTLIKICKFLSRFIGFNMPALSLGLIPFLPLEAMFF